MNHLSAVRIYTENHFHFPHNTTHLENRSILYESPVWFLASNHSDPKIGSKCPLLGVTISDWSAFVSETTSVTPPTALGLVWFGVRIYIFPPPLFTIYK